MSDNIGAAKIDLQGNDIAISTLDSVFSSWKKEENTPVCLSLIKIDVEGISPQVLMGAKNTIIEHKPHIFAEAATKDELEKIHELLSPLGYKKLLGHWGATPVYHFVHNPTLSIVITAYYMQLYKIFSKLFRRFHHSME